PSPWLACRSVRRSRGRADVGRADAREPGWRRRWRWRGADRRAGRGAVGVGRGTALDPQAVADAATGATGSDLVPLPVRAFARPIAEYRRYARGEASVLAARAAVLTGALRSGDR